MWPEIGKGIACVVVLLIGFVVSRVGLAVIKYQWSMKKYREIEWPWESDMKLPMMNAFSTSSGLDRFLDRKYWFDKNGKMKSVVAAGAYFDGSPAVAFSEPDTIKQLLDDESYPKLPATYDFIGLILGNGLVTSKGELWKKMRKIMTPPLHGNHLTAIGPALVQSAQDMVQELRTRAANAPSGPLGLDVVEFFSGVTSAFAAHSIFGQMNPEVARWWYVINVQITPYFLADLILGQALSRNIPWPWTIKFNRAMEQLTVAMRASIAQCRQRLIECPSFSRDSDLLTTLVTATDENGQFLDERQIIDEALTISFASTFYFAFILFLFLIN